jgi:putative membrane protein
MQVVIKIVINAIALVVAALVVPKFNLDFGSGTSGYIYVAVVAIVFGLVNTYIKPIATLVSLPLNLFALGLVGFIVNVAMLFLTVFVINFIRVARMPRETVARLENLPLENDDHA